MGIIAWLFVGLVAGWLTGRVMGGPGKGLLLDIIVGLVGALVGGVLMSLLGFRSEGGLIYTIVVAFIGAVVSTWTFRKLTASRVIARPGRV